MCYVNFIVAPNHIRRIVFRTPFLYLPCVCASDGHSTDGRPLQLIVNRRRRRLSFVRSDRQQWLSGKFISALIFYAIFFGIQKRNSANSPFSSIVSRSFFLRSLPFGINVKTFNFRFRHRHVVWLSSVNNLFADKRPAIAINLLQFESFTNYSRCGTLLVSRRMDLNMQWNAKKSLCDWNASFVIFVLGITDTK